MDTKKLRQKILDLAIHGKLVPQDPNDEPASVLLERIKAEKEQLIKEGKIKRQKKSTSSDTSHYENDVPFEVPKGWVWCRLGDVFSHNTGKALNSSNKEGENLTYITTSNVYWDRFELNDLKKMPFTNSELEKCTVSKGDLLVCEGGDIGRSAIWNFDYDIRIQNHIHRLRPISEANVHFYYYVLMYNKQAGLIGGKGIGLMGLSSGELDKMIVPLPPIKEQCRITKEIEKLFAIVSLIEEDESDLKNAIQKAKSTILDLAISGRLTSHTSHYPQLPERWKYKQLEDVLDYEQPQKYIVESTEYSDDYTTPVLTAGKSFIIGHTNERSGICTDVPVIIFDDFTTDSKFVDFPFKVKSSAMKILHPKGDINLKYLAYFMSITRLVGTTHKRYWISEYSKIKVPIPPKEEQDKIVFLIEAFYSLIDSIFVDQS